MSVDVNAERERILNYLAQSRRMGDNVAILGGEDLPETTVFECLVQANPDRRVVHLDATRAMDDAAVEAKVQEGLKPNQILLITLSEAAGVPVFKVLEELLQEDSMERPGKRVTRPQNWQLVVHSRPGPFPFDDLLPARLALP